MLEKFYVDPDITKAETLPASFYKDLDIFEATKEAVFLKSWHWVGDEDVVKQPQSQYPFTLLNGFLDEPLVLSKNKEGDIHCLLNVCTHRGNLVVLNPGKSKEMVCSYHGRKFNLNGTFEFMPEFEKAKNFPRPCDNLHGFPLKRWGSFLFAGLNPIFDFQQVIDKMNERVGFLPLNDFKFDATISQDYLVHANWALYCDNYLEGFHVPFVHKDLNGVLDYGSYKTEIYDYCNVQIGYTKEATEVFDFPDNHKDYGENIGAYYYWVFPNMMFNFYPWGVSINVVQPIDINRTKVSFLSYVLHPTKLNQGASQDIDKVQREDEIVVENVHRGVKSSFYKSGRFSPTREKGVHHFHMLLSKFLTV